MYAEFLNNKQNGLDSWIWASHNEIDGRVSCSSNIPPVQDLIWRSFYSRAQIVSCKSIFNGTSETQHTGMWRNFFLFSVLCINNNPPSPPISEEILLHKRNSVESPRGILSLFRTRVRLLLNSPFQRLWWHGYVVFLWNRSFFLRWITADPSPWGNFTPPTKYECGETLGDLEPVYDLCPITGEFALPELWHRHVCGINVKQVVFLTVNHRGPLPLRELHSTDEIIMSVERPWGILSLFTTCFP